MRFFAHDGKTTHGPAVVDELLKLPGFDGDTLVCPVGAANSEDWKPALAYPPFKRALLSPEPPAPKPIPPPAFTPRIKTTPCPRCEHRNPEEARYCNDCGARMDAKLEVVAAALETAPPSDPFAPLDPMLSFPTAEPATVPMSAIPTPQAVGARPAWKRPAILAAFASAAIVALGLSWRILVPMSAVPTTAVPMSAVPTPAPAASADSPVPPSPVDRLPSETSQLPFTNFPKKSDRAITRGSAASTRRSDAAKRPRRPKSALAVEPNLPRKRGGGDVLIESRDPAPKAGEMDPLLESLLAADSDVRARAEKSVEKDAPIIGQRPASAQAPEEPKHLSLPGLDRPVSVADRTALAQVHEQFDFCVQLLAQGAYGDHYDTCLCKDTREAAPYRGRRGFYMSALKKDASAGRLENAAKIISSKLAGGAATVTARWKSRPDDRGRDLTQTWRLEDGLWCRTP